VTVLRAAVSTGVEERPRIAHRLLSRYLPGMHTQSLALLAPFTPGAVELPGNVSAQSRQASPCRVSL
jgi:hypothetical protein